jgi:hypothetical protein
MKVSPPKLHKLFWVTQRVALVAMAASTMFPPDSKTLAPTVDDCKLDDETTPFLEKAFGLVLIMLYFILIYMLCLSKKLY